MLRTRIIAVAGMVALALAVPATASASPAYRHPHRPCAPVAAAGVGQDLGDGQTTATVYVHGLMIGTTTGSFTITGVVGSIASFTGPIDFSLPGGTLTAPVTGTLDTATGEFVSSSSSVSGYGVYAAVVGSLTFRGTENLATGAFTETISGRLCLTPRTR